MIRIFTSETEPAEGAVYRDIRGCNVDYGSSSSGGEGEEVFPPCGTCIDTSVVGIISPPGCATFLVTDNEFGRLPTSFAGDVYTDPYGYDDRFESLAAPFPAPDPTCPTPPSTLDYPDLWTRAGDISAALQDDILQDDCYCLGEGVDRNILALGRPQFPRVTPLPFFAFPNISTTSINVREFNPDGPPLAGDCCPTAGDVSDHIIAEIVDNEIQLTRNKKLTDFPELYRVDDTDPSFQVVAGYPRNCCMLDPCAGSGNVASAIIHTPVSLDNTHTLTTIIAVGGVIVLTITNHNGVAYTATPTLSGNTHEFGCNTDYPAVYASAVIHSPDTWAAHGITLEIEVGGSTVLTVTNHNGVAYTDEPTLSGVTHDLGVGGIPDPTTDATPYFAALAHLLDQLDNVSAVANGATDVTITADEQATSTYDIVIGGSGVTPNPNHFGKTEVVGNAFEPPSATQYFAALAYLLDQLPDVSAVADGATSVTITADEKATSTYDIEVTGSTILPAPCHFVITTEAGNEAGDFVLRDLHFPRWPGPNSVTENRDADNVDSVRETRNPYELVEADREEPLGVIPVVVDVQCHTDGLVYVYYANIVVHDGHIAGLQWHVSPPRPDNLALWAGNEAPGAPEDLEVNVDYQDREVFEEFDPIADQEQDKPWCEDTCPQAAVQMDKADEACLPVCPAESLFCSDGEYQIISLGFGAAETNAVDAAFANADDDTPAYCKEGGAEPYPYRLCYVKWNTEVGAYEAAVTFCCDDLSSSGSATA